MISTLHLRKLLGPALLLLLLQCKIQAQPMPLDSSFGVNGIRKIQYGFSDLIRDIESLPNGKILVAGNTNNTAYLLRYLSNGALDQSFGTQGYLPFSSDTVDYHLELLPLPDGKFVSVGQSKDFNSPFQTPLFAVARFLSNGTPDYTFGKYGVTTTQIGVAAFAQYGALQPDGKILVFGQTSQGPSLRFAWARYLPNGKIDSTFSNDGIAFLPGSTSCQPSCIKVLSDGAILSGGVEFVNSELHVLVCKLLPNGNLDSTFAENGVFSQGFGHAFEAISDLDVLPDRKIIMAGWVGDSPIGTFTLLRLNADGTADTDFGNDGIKTFPFGVESFYSRIKVLPNGKFIAAGYFNEIPIGSIAQYQAALFRFTPNGDLDPSFNGTGVGILNTESNMGIDDISIEADASIIIGGFFSINDSSPPHTLLARVKNQGLNPTKTPSIAEKVSISPNPASNRAELRFSLSKAATMRILLLDDRQSVIRTVQPGAWMPSGVNRCFIDVSDLPTGVYRVVLEGAAGVQSVPLVVAGH